VPDAEDAVGYANALRFAAASEGAYAVVDLGPYAQNIPLAVNDSGGVATRGDGVDSEFAIRSLDGQKHAVTGGFADLNNAGAVLFEKDPGSLSAFVRGADGATRELDYADPVGALRFDDSDEERRRDGIAGVTPLFVADSGTAYVRAGGKYDLLTSDSPAPAPGIQSYPRTVFEGDGVIAGLSSTRGWYEDLSADASELVMRVSGTTGTTSFEPGALDSFARGGTTGSVQFRQLERLLPTGSNGWVAVREKLLWTGGTAPYHHYAAPFSERTIGADVVNSFGEPPLESSEPDAFDRLSGATRFPDGELRYVYGDLLSKGAPEDGVRILRAALGGPLGADAAFAGNGVAVGTFGIWRNGRVLADAEIFGPDPDWSDFGGHPRIADRGKVIAGSALNADTGRKHALLLLKMEVAAHMPAELIDRDGNLQTGAEIPSADEDTASDLQFVVNDDNDFQAGYSSNYPKAMDLSGNFHQREDDLVAVKLEFPANIDTGTLEISANVDRSSPEARAYVIAAGGMFPPSKELVALSPATSVDLSSASNTDLLWDLADQGEQTLYIEGLAAKSDLEVNLTFEVNGAEVASESVHMQLLPSTERTLKVLAYSGMGHRAMVHMNNSDNVLREDHDGYQGNADRVTPIAFRQDGAVSSRNVKSSWRFVDAHVPAQTRPIYDELLRQEKNVYLCEDLYNAGGQARSGEEIMILGKAWVSGQPTGPSEGVLAHEWLHAFADVNHVNITDDIMWGTSPPPAGVDTNGNGILDGNETMVDSGHKGDISQDNYDHFIE